VAVRRPPRTVTARRAAAQYTGGEKSGLMCPVDWKKLEAWFEQTVSLPRDRQDAFLEEKARELGPLAGELRALLDAHHGTHPLLDLASAANIAPGAAGGSVPD